MSSATSMLGALARLDSLITKLRGKSPEEFAKNATKVGERWWEAADAPEFFERGRAFANTDEGLAKQFGVRPPELVENPEHVEIFGSRAWYAPQDLGRNPTWAKSALYEKDKSAGQLLNYPSGQVQLASAAGLVDPKRAFRVFDTATLDGGSGQGTRLYPAAFGSLRNRPNLYNLVDGLSPENAIRRNFNQSAAILRDPQMGDRIITSGQQLRSIPGLGIGAVHGMTRPQQVGALQLAGATGTLEGVKGRLAGGMKNLNTGRFGPREEAQRAYELEQLSHQIHRLDGTTGALTQLGVKLKALPDTGTVTPLGERTARRLGLTLRALDGDRNFSDLTRGLEYRGGGSVKC